MRILIGLVAVLFSAAVAFGATSDPSGSGSTPVLVTGGGSTAVLTTGSGSGYSNDALIRASAMTQQMSLNSPISGHEYHLHGNDEQLRLSSDPAFVKALEAYQKQIDRMLARN